MVGVFQSLAWCVVESGGLVVGVFQRLAWCVVESGGEGLSENGLVCC